MMVRTIILAGTLFFSLALHAQQKLSTEQYIDLYSKIAVSEMYRTGIPASIKMAQGILESGSGNSRLATEGNNHFGIKCHKEWAGPTIHADDDAKNECFRKYKFAEESFLDHSDFLTTRSRYASLFELDKTDYKGWAHGLKKAGYATNPQYANLLIGLIERYELNKFDYSDPNQIVKYDNDPKKGDDQTSKAETYSKNIFTTNRIKTVYLQPDQTLNDIADIYDIRIKRLERYNEVDEQNQPVAGMKVFLQPKRKKGAVKSHKVGKGETMYSISQLYGVKMESLYKKNNLSEGEEPAIGERINLRKNKKSATKTRDVSKEKKEPRILAKNTKEKEAPVKAEEKASANEQKVEDLKAVANENAYQKRSNSTKEVEDGDLLFIDSEDHQVKLDIKKGQEKEASTTGKGFKKEKAVEQKLHVVREGDTLYNVSKRYNITVAQIREWNALEADVIKIGQTIIVGVSK